MISPSKEKDKDPDIKTKYIMIKGYLKATGGIQRTAQDSHEMLS